MRSGSLISRLGRGVCSGVRLSGESGEQLAEHSSPVRPPFLAGEVAGAFELGHAVGGRDEKRGQPPWILPEQIAGTHGGLGGRDEYCETL